MQTRGKSENDDVDEQQHGGEISINHSGASEKRKNL
jgi:hypothetical protein